MYTPKGKRVFTNDPEIELISKVTGLPYQGSFIHNTAEDTYTDSSGTIQLERVAKDTPLSENDVDLLRTKYDLVKKDNKAYNLRATKAIQPYTPTPTEEDYRAGLFVRYFAQHKQDGKVLEISKITFQALEGESTSYHYPSYLIGSTVWFLRGPVANQDVNGYIVRGTAEKHGDMLDTLEQKIPNIRTYLTDPTQFVK